MYKRIISTDFLSAFTFDRPKFPSFTGIGPLLSPQIYAGVLIDPLISWGQYTSRDGSNLTSTKYIKIGNGNWIPYSNKLVTADNTSYQVRENISDGVNDRSYFSNTVVTTRREETLIDILSPSSTKLEILWPDPRYWYSDSGGTTQWTTTGTPVRAWRSNSGTLYRQTDNASAPIGIRLPKSGLRNRSVETEFENGYNLSYHRMGGNYTFEPLVGPSNEFQNGVRFAGTVSTTTFVYNTVPGVRGMTMTCSCYCRMDDGTAPVFGNIVAERDFRFIFGQTSVYGNPTTTNLGGGLYRISASGVVGDDSDYLGIVKDSMGLKRGFVVSGFQVEFGSQVTPYQKVSSPYDATESGVPDAYWLKFDGVNDWLESSVNIDYSTSDEIFVSCGFNKTPDEAINAIAKLGGLNTEGSFYLMTTQSQLNKEVGFYSIGTPAQLRGEAYAVLPLSVNHVVSGIADISAPLSKIRLNGVELQVKTNDQGTGNYRNDKIYVGRNGPANYPFNGLIGPLIVRGGPVPSLSVINQTESIINSLVGAY